MTREALPRTLLLPKVLCGLAASAALAGMGTGLAHTVPLWAFCVALPVTVFSLWGACTRHPVTAWLLFSVACFAAGMSVGTGLLSMHGAAAQLGVCKALFSAAAGFLAAAVTARRTGLSLAPAGSVLLAGLAATVMMGLLSLWWNAGTVGGTLGPWAVSVVFTGYMLGAASRRCAEPVAADAVQLILSLYLGRLSPLWRNRLSNGGRRRLQEDQFRRSAGRR